MKEQPDGISRERRAGIHESRVFSRHQLPARFLLYLDDPPEPPAFPEPSATLVLLREGPASLEVLLLERNPRSGFIPGAWVFPGGRVDASDGDPLLLTRVLGLSPEEAEARLGPRESGPKALAYWVAAVRETFEETGILLAGHPARSGEAGRDGPGGGGSASLREEVPDGEIISAQERLLTGESSFLAVLETLDRTLNATGIRYIGHWLTPECEARRYDTRFFIAEVSDGVMVRPHEKEMTDYLWLTPGEALKRNREGDLPLVLPTLYTLEELDSFPTPREAMEHMESGPHPRRLPVPERTPDGIRFSFRG